MARDEIGTRNTGKQYGGKASSWSNGRAVANYANFGNKTTGTAREDICPTPSGFVVSIYLYDFATSLYCDVMTPPIVLEQNGSSGQPSLSKNTDRDANYTPKQTEKKNA